MMKASWIKICRGAVLITFLTAPILRGQSDESGADATESQSKAQSVSDADLQILEEFLNLNDDDLARIQALIQKIRNMSPEEKAAYRARIRAFHAMEPDRRMAIRRGWGHVSEEIRRGWREMMHSLPNEERARIQNRMFEMGPEEKKAYREKLVEEYLKNERVK